MPIAQFYLVAGAHDDAAVGALLVSASHAYAETLYPGMGQAGMARVRAFAVPVPPQHWASAGVLASEGGASAPYFTCLALAGRPLSQMQALLAIFTDLVVAHLGVARERVRGQVLPIDPALWAIGGVPASIVRANEAVARGS